MIIPGPQEETPPNSGAGYRLHAGLLSKYKQFSGLHRVSYAWLKRCNQQARLLDIEDDDDFDDAAAGQAHKRRHDATSEHTHRVYLDIAPRDLDRVQMYLQEMESFDWSVRGARAKFNKAMDEKVSL